KTSTYARYEEILKEKKAKFYRRKDGSTGITWKSIGADVEAFLDLLETILLSADSAGQEYRHVWLDDIYANLVARSPLFKNLTLTFSNRQENTLEHVRKVSVFTDDPASDQKSPQLHRAIQRLEAIAHDLGKYFVARWEINKSDEVVFKLSNDFTQDHAFIGGLIFDELLFRVSESSYLTNHPIDEVRELFEALKLNTPEGRRVLTGPITYHHLLENHGHGHFETQQLATILKSPFQKDLERAKEGGNPEELDGLNEQLLISLRHFILLSMADVGAGGNPLFIVENARAARFLINHMVVIEGFAECKTLYEVLAGSMGRILYEMGMCLELSLAGDDAMREQKKMGIMQNISIILEAERKLEEKMSADPESLEIISQVRQMLGDGIIQLISVIHHKLQDAEVRIINQSDYAFMQLIVTSIYEKVASSCTEIANIVSTWFEKNPIPTLMLMQQSDEDVTQGPLATAI
ncbi:MAG: hypothetical protein WAU07_01065, partial [Microgenomates group bacterium]